MKKVHDVFYVGAIFSQELSKVGTEFQSQN
jgi:hypothetical protein